MTSTPTTTLAPGKHIARALQEAREQFGLHPADPGAVGRWVARRVAELAGDPAAKAAHPQLFDDELVDVTRPD